MGLSAVSAGERRAAMRGRFMASVCISPVSKRSAAPRTAIRANNVGCSLAASSRAHAPAEKPIPSTEPCLTAPSRTRSAASRPTASLDAPWPGRSTPITVRPAASNLATQPCRRHCASKFDPMPLMRMTGRSCDVLCELVPLNFFASLANTEDRKRESAGSARTDTTSLSSPTRSSVASAPLRSACCLVRRRLSDKTWHQRTQQDVLRQEYFAEPIAVHPTWGTFDYAAELDLQKLRVAG